MTSRLGLSLYARRMDSHTSSSIAGVLLFNYCGGCHLGKPNGLFYFTL